ncbi:MAG TPA: DUF4326 domain-containing protein [Acidimicrobiales bacterium]|nr:DUF4326 domain-containing protein [Acidimicrobiales bacterium]
MSGTRRPSRVQLRRAKGWRKPEGAIVVARPSRWGNPFAIGAPHPDHGRPMTREDTIALHRAHVGRGGAGELHAAELAQLRGHDLACWCRLDEACHADTLLGLANA